MEQSTEILQNPNNSIWNKCLLKFKSIPKKRLQIFWWVAVLVIVFVIAMINMISIPSKQWHWSAGDINLDDLLDDGAVDKQETINCLNEKWITFYGSASCGFGKNDVAKYGKDMKNFPMVDCDDEQTLCDMAGITECPARSDWTKVEYDIKNIDDLGSAFGCN